MDYESGKTFITQNKLWIDRFLVLIIFPISYMLSLFII